MSPGMDAGRNRPPDPDLARALAHPLRQRILERLSAGGETSPSQLARLLDAPLSNVAYHVRVLLQLGCVELAGTQQRRGALEHRYRAIAHPWLDIARTLRDIGSHASEAGVAGEFDQPHARLQRLSLVLDEQGRQDAAALLDQTLTSLQQIHTDSTIRAADDEAGPTTSDTEIALLLFRRAPRSS
jgi:DNA-binding transcriptional ArsR family regulator